MTHHPTLTEIRHATQAVRCVCVDYFDTVVLRTVAPEDIKRIVCARLARALNIGVSGSTLYEWRAAIEAELCQRNQREGHDPEFDVLACYADLWRRIPDHRRPDADFFKQLCLELELSAECAAQRPDNHVISLLDELRSSGKDCCLISDFYMPTAAFTRMLRHHGIEHLFSRVFVSADTLLTKRSGRLYDHVLETLKLPPHEILMVGDNRLADVDRPQSRNLRAIHVNRDAQHTQYVEWQRQSGNLKKIESSVSEILDAQRGNHPFPELALTLYAFTERLYERLLGEGVKDVFFMSREGQPLKRLFDAYQAWRQPSRAIAIRSHYLEVSRRATFLPSLDEIDRETFHTLFRQYRAISTKEFLLSLGLEELLADLGQTSDFDLNERLENFPASREFRVVVSDQRFCEAYASERASRRDAFRRYLASFEMQTPQPTLHTVDVGWKGTIQDNLAKLLRLDRSFGFSAIRGFYLGLTETGAVAHDNAKFGILFDLTNTPTPHARTFNENRALFEVMLAADHGSVSRYRLDAASKPYVEHDPFAESALFEGYVRPMQSQLEASFERLCDVLLTRHYPADWLMRLAARNHARMVFGATQEEVQWFSSVYHIENFGVFEESRFGADGSPRSIGNHLRFTARLLRHRGRLNLGFWPWLTIAREGGPIAALAYRTLRRFQD